MHLSPDVAPEAWPHLPLALHAKAAAAEREVGRAGGGGKAGLELDALERALRRGPGHDSAAGEARVEENGGLINYMDRR